MADAKRLKVGSGSALSRLLRQGSPSNAGTRLGSYLTGGGYLGDKKPKGKAKRVKAKK